MAAVAVAAPPGPRQRVGALRVARAAAVSARRLLYVIWGAGARGREGARGAFCATWTAVCSTPIQVTRVIAGQIIRADTQARFLPARYGRRRMDLHATIVALHGALGSGNRLPIELCVQIADRSTNDVLACTSCHTPLLYQVPVQPFAAGTPIAWHYRGGSFLCSSRGCVPANQSVAGHSVLHLAKHGECTPSQTPESLAVGNVIFENRCFQLRQHVWYKRLSDGFYCARCTLIFSRAHCAFLQWVRSVRRGARP